MAQGARRSQGSNEEALTPNQGGPSTSVSIRLLAAVGRFDEAWANGQRPMVESHLPLPGPERDDLLPHLVAVELERRCTAGEAILVEAYLARFPSLTEQPAAVVELLAIEYRHRRPPPTTDELQRRFPEYVSALAVRLGTASTTPPAAAESESDKPHAAAADQAKVADGALPVIPGYEILKELGHGGMGVVYLAWQTSLKRLVALKRIRVGDQAGQGARARFRTEAEAVARLQHPNIVQIHEIGEAEGAPFFSLEYVEGGSLADYLRGKPQPSLPAAALVETLARAMHHAHERGILHRDLKPGNVLLSFSRESEKEDATLTKRVASSFSDSRLNEYVPKITDFGLAKLVDVEQGQTQSGEIMGTAAYVSPEQAMGKTRRVGSATDVYSLGAILYELLTGRPPFLAATMFDAMVELMSREPLPPRRLQAAIPRDLETICLKCLEKEPGRRYASAAALAEDLRRYQAGEPIAARPIGRLERGWRWCRRNPVVAGLVAAVALSLCGGTAIATWQAMVARTEARRAETRLEQIEKGTKILGSIFADLDPHLEEKEGKPLLEILGQRIQKVAGELEGESIADALAMADLQQILGDSLINLGYYLPAKALLEKSAATYAHELGDEDEKALGSRCSLARAFLANGDLNLAIPLLESTLKAQETTLGDAHPATLTTRNNLATAYKDNGNLDGAIALFERVLRDREAILGEDHLDSITSRNNLGVAYKNAGKMDLAIPLLGSNLKACETKLGNNHRDTLRALNNLASAYEAAKNLKLAIPLYERTVKLQEAKLGKEHPDTLTACNNLANAYRADNKLDLAIELLQCTLKLQETKLGPNHPDSLTSRNNLASAYLTANKAELAIPLFQQILQVVEARFPHDHPDLLLTRNNLATAYKAAGNLRLALSLFDKVVPQARKKPGIGDAATMQITTNWILTLEGDHQYARAAQERRGLLAVQRRQFGSDELRLARALSPLGGTLLKAGQPAEAESVLRECLTIRTKKEPDAWTTFDTQSLLGGALMGQKKYAEAEPLLVSGYEGMKQREAKIPSQGKIRLTEALERLVQLYEATGKGNRAAKWRMELDALKGPGKQNKQGQK
jgi:serine/threonine protein kinase